MQGRATLVCGVSTVPGLAPEFTQHFSGLDLEKSNNVASITLLVSLGPSRDPPTGHEQQPPHPHAHTHRDVSSVRYKSDSCSVGPGRDDALLRNPRTGCTTHS